MASSVQCFLFGIAGVHSKNMVENRRRTTDHGVMFFYIFKPFPHLLIFAFYHSMLYLGEIINFKAPTWCLEEQSKPRSAGVWGISDILSDILQM